MLNRTYISRVPGFEGACKPTWLNDNQVCRITDGVTTGFFRNTKVKHFCGFAYTVFVGEEFHGYIDRRGYVHSTEGIYV